MSEHELVRPSPTVARRRLAAARASLTEAEHLSEELAAEVTESADRLDELIHIHGRSHARVREAEEEHARKVERLTSAIETVRAAEVGLKREKLVESRAMLAEAQRKRERLAAEVAVSAKRLNRLRRSKEGDHQDVRDAEAEHEGKTDRLAAARAAERTARKNLVTIVNEWLPFDPGDDVKRLSTEFPLALFPVRLETRFDTGPGRAPVLKVRVYPDEILADTHEPALTQRERADGLAYWRAVWDDAAKEPEEWRRLLISYRSQRAAWIVRATEPTNLAVRPNGRPIFPDTEPRTGRWTRAAEAWHLPDRWIVLAYRGGMEVHRAISLPVQEPLALTMNPDSDPADSVDISGDGLRLDTDAAWTFDYARAEAAGMAVTIPLEHADLTEGFDRILVVGVKSSASAGEGSIRLEELLESHHYGRGLAFVRQGTPTNNTSAEPAAFPPPDPGGSASFDVERKGPLAVDGSDGASFMRALGVPPRVADHLAGADGTEQKAARAMNDALWPVTFEYYLSQMMAPLFDREAIRVAHRYYVDHVRARGPYPAFRVGRVPYGLLPVTSLSRWKPTPGAVGPDRYLPGLLSTLRAIWLAEVDRVPRIGRTPDDPDADLLAVLGMDAVTREVRVRQVLGKTFTYNLFRLLGLPWEEWANVQRQVGRDAMAAVRHPEWDPRILGVSFADRANRFGSHFVAPDPLSETEGLAPVDNYIAGIRGATIRQLRDETFQPPSQRPVALLYYLLRHAALTGYAQTAMDIVVRHEAGASERTFDEPELVRIVEGTERQVTIWERFERPVEGFTARPLAEFLRTSRDTPDTKAIERFETALDELSNLPTAELDRLTRETLGTCSYRLDAWITSLAHKRLAEMRRARPTGSYLGAYGWVENLRRVVPTADGDRILADGRTARAQPGNGGLIHAPSMSHAAAAAILRNAHLSRAGQDRERYTIDLSSERVRTARWVLDAVRNGQPLGAVLGYRIERALHDRQLDKYIQPLRLLYPLQTANAEETNGPAAGEAAESVPPRDVVNGLTLRKAWRDGTVPFGSKGLPGAGGDREALEAEFTALDSAVDAVADLLTAESVYQLVRGTTAGAAATLDAMAKGVRPPDPEIASVPRGGTALTHRVAVVLGGDGLAVDTTNMWTQTPRADAEPYLNGWVGALLGDPREVKCRVSYRDPREGEPERRTEHKVTLAKLQLAPLDVLALAQGADATAQASEVDQRVAYVALGHAPETTDVQITYAPDPSWDRNTVRTFPEILELARAINAVVGGARALRPVDLLLPENADGIERADVLPGEATIRAAAATKALEDARETLKARVADAESDTPDRASSLTALRQALLAASQFGVGGAIPDTRKGSSDAIRDALLKLAERVLADLEARFQQAGDPSKGPAEVLHAVFGREFVFLPRFKLASPETGELAQAIAAGPALVGDPSEPVKWLQQAGRVRPSLARWRKLSLYAGALGAPLSGLEVAQLPHIEGGRWVALKFADETKRPPSGRVSLVLHRSARPAADAEWVGLLLDEWSEIIPRTRAETGIAFHYDDPGAEAPQAVLLAAPPTDAPTWDLDTLIDILHETLDHAKIRAVDGDLLGDLGQLLPTVFLADNPANDTISTNLTPMLIAEQTFIAAEF